MSVKPWIKGLQRVLLFLFCMCSRTREGFLRLASSVDAPSTEKTTSPSACSIERHTAFCARPGSPRTSREVVGVLSHSQSTETPTISAGALKDPSPLPDSTGVWRRRLFGSGLSSVTASRISLFASLHSKERLSIPQLTETERPADMDGVTEQSLVAVSSVSSLGQHEEVRQEETAETEGGDAIPFPSGLTSEEEGGGGDKEDCEADLKEKFHSMATDQLCDFMMETVAVAGGSSFPSPIRRKISTACAVLCMKINQEGEGGTVEFSESSFLTPARLVGLVNVFLVCSTRMDLSRLMTSLSREIARSSCLLNRMSSAIYNAEMHEALTDKDQIPVSPPPPHPCLSKLRDTDFVHLARALASARVPSPECFQVIAAEACRRLRSLSAESSVHLVISLVMASASLNDPGCLHPFPEPSAAPWVGKRECQEYFTVAPFEGSFDSETSLRSCKGVEGVPEERGEGCFESRQREAEGDCLRAAVLLIRHCDRSWGAKQMRWVGGFWKQWQRSLIVLRGAEKRLPLDARIIWRGLRNSWETLSGSAASDQIRQTSSVPPKTQQNEMKPPGSRRKRRERRRRQARSEKRRKRDVRITGGRLERLVESLKVTQEMSEEEDEQESREGGEGGEEAQDRDKEEEEGEEEREKGGREEEEEKELLRSGQNENIEFEPQMDSVAVASPSATQESIHPLASPISLPFCVGAREYPQWIS
uniref:Uncharacterized protein n=1 Tax=Chromera velia CCMP2878 TaxID=1169474 RepID=A0A0G4FQR3_9ALVE|eukprot:Cvel_18209.t1-p1 / transcript=Cvel_18209.t1 / gene=Cvel_18209 / organism=Chromera_velia_CCMP2878 / gene_product=hypothetical protein / transcript_product=hypothetical protein / location=Cvel_scaffold1495:39283-41824(-) / protein_length=705 / sequence_SO=supercontig / SO=protein_coding / is_pseudo=false